MATEKISLNVDATMMKAMHAFIAVGDLRYYLEGINIRPHPTKGAIIEASDGHRAGIIHDPEAVCEMPMLVRLDKSALTKIKAGDKFAIIDGRAIIYRKGVEIFVQPGNPFIDGKFPDLQRLLKGKTFAPGIVQTANWNYIEACMLKPLMGRRYLEGLRFFHEEREDDDQNGMVLVRHATMTEFLGIVMPMRDGPGEALPDWLKA